MTQGILQSFTFSDIFGRLYVCQNQYTLRSLRYIGGSKTVINSLN